MPAIESNVPTMIDGNGEVIRVLTAHDLLRAAGIDLEAADLVRRLDRRGSWTYRENGLEVKSSSPEAGTVAYDSTRLFVALADLVDAAKIDREAADNALEWVTPTAPAYCGARA